MKSKCCQAPLIIIERNGIKSMVCSKCGAILSEDIEFVEDDFTRLWRYRKPNGLREVFELIPDKEIVRKIADLLMNNQYKLRINGMRYKTAIATAYYLLLKLTKRNIRMDDISKLLKVSPASISRIVRRVFERKDIRQEIVDIIKQGHNVVLTTFAIRFMFY
ncbi:MAG: hypothetical protein Q6363_005310 [Candidatus Njordarchaeota archaeon]